MEFTRIVYFKLQAETPNSRSERTELKQSNLALQWKGLLGHIDTRFQKLQDEFDSERNSLQTRFQELQDQFDLEQNSPQARYQELEDREKELEEKVFSFHSKMESKAQELHGIERLTEERIKEVDVTEKRLVEVEKLVKEKETKCDLIQKSIEEGTEKLCWVRKSLEERSKELEIKEEEVTGAQGVLNAFREDIELNRRQLNAIRGSVEKEKNVLVLKQEGVKAAGKSLEECHKEIKLKKERLCLIQKVMVQCSNSLQSREKTIREMELKVKDYGLLKKSMEEWSCKLESKERELEGWVEKFELRNKQVESKFEELNLIHNRANEYLNEVEVQAKELELKQKQFDLMIQKRQRDLDSQDKLLQEQAKEIELKQKQFDLMIQERQKHLESEEKLLQEQAKELELKQKQFDSTQKSMETNVPSSSSIQSSANRNGRGLQLLMNENLKRIDLVGREISGVLQASSDPAKLVLDAMQGFYPSNLNVDNQEFDYDLRVIRRSCLLLLQELKRFSPQINPHVRDKAMELAADWKAKIKVATENWLEILGFLRLVSTYEFTTAYDAKELQTLLAIVVKQDQATEFCQAFGITNKAPVGNIVSLPVKIDEPECLPSQPHVGLDVKKDAISLAVQWQEKMRADTENSLEILGFLQFVAAYGLLSTLNGDEIVKLLGMICQHAQALELCEELGFADKIPELIGRVFANGLKMIDKPIGYNIMKMYMKLRDCLQARLILLGSFTYYFVQDLIERKQLFEAVKTYLHLQGVLVHKHIADFRAVVQCLKDNNLESDFLAKDVETEIAVLETLKKSMRSSVKHSNETQPLQLRQTRLTIRGGDMRVVGDVMADSAYGFLKTSLSFRGQQRPNHLGFVDQRFTTVPDDVVGG
ncbi:hypothetical protein PRUPE_6G334100 [Prunus persica]|uniref:FRIGIDA-like protein n=1 Tax=Prunus persica TaxID=3760 RepID=A0A251NZD4_PRUPE|nr:hypothetical protein PRUPE_6G334100 [Prunus persica]